MDYIFIDGNIFDDNECPIEGAFLKEIIVTDTRYFKTEEAYNLKLGGNWRDIGENHGIDENGHIKREFKEKKWHITINSLEELNKLVEDYGDIELASNHSGTKGLTIIVNRY